MAIKVIVQFQARPGKRAELRTLLTSIAATHGPSATGFRGSTVYETLDNEDGLVEIADWESAQDQAAAVQEATAMGVYAPVVELVAAPFSATRIGSPSRPRVPALHEGTSAMWAQIITTRVKAAVDTEAVASALRAAQQGLRAAEQPDSGLLQTLVMQDQNDPRRVFTLVVFETEEKARAPEQDPRRERGIGAARAAMTELFEGSAEFTDLAVVCDWAD